MYKPVLVHDDFSYMSVTPNPTWLLFYLSHNDGFLIKIPKFGTLKLFFYNRKLVAPLLTMKNLSTVQLGILK